LGVCWVQNQIGVANKYKKGGVFSKKFLNIFNLHALDLQKTLRSVEASLF
jgi:hypothetical protein